MHQAEIIVLLFTVVAASVLIARKMALPYPVVLVLVGLGLEFCSASAGGKTGSKHRFLFLFAAAALSSRVVHFVARFSAKSAANCPACYRVGAFHDDRSRLRGALADSVHAVGRGFCPGGNRFSS